MVARTVKIVSLLVSFRFQRLDAMQSQIDRCHLIDRTVAHDLQIVNPAVLSHRRIRQDFDTQPECARPSSLSFRLRVDVGRAILSEQRVIGMPNRAEIQGSIGKHSERKSHKLN